MGFSIALLTYNDIIKMGKMAYTKDASLASLKRDILGIIVNVLKVVMDLVHEEIRIIRETLRQFTKKLDELSAPKMSVP